MDTKLTVDLDIAFAPADLAVGLVAITEDHPTLTYRVVSLEGPGGWPVVRFEAEASALSDFVLEYFDGDLEAASVTLMQ